MATYVLEQLEAIGAITREAGIGLVAGISMAFGSPYEDESRPDDVLRLVERCVALEPEHVYVADTLGAAQPAWVEAMCEAIRVRWPELSLAVRAAARDIAELLGLPRDRDRAAPDATEVAALAGLAQPIAS